MAKSVTFGFDIFPICLPKVAITDENKWKGLPATITGYGSKTGVDTSTLHYAKLSVLEHQVCTRKHYDDLIASNTEESMELQERVRVFLSEEKFTSELICSMASTEELGTCPGDSGGPLVHYNEESGMNFQIGVVFGSLQVKFRHYCLVTLDLKNIFRYCVCLPNFEYMSFLYSNCGQVLLFRAPSSSFKTLF